MESFHTGGSPVPTGALSSGSCGTGLYFTTQALSFLERKLNPHGLRNWKQLAGCMNLSDLAVQKIELEDCKVGQSATKFLLRNYQQERGGVNLDEFKLLLRNIRREDILTDLKENFEDQGVPFLEKNVEEVFVPLPAPRPPAIPEPASLPPGQQILLHATVVSSGLSLDPTFHKVHIIQPASINSNPGDAGASPTCSERNSGDVHPLSSIDSARSSGPTEGRNSWPNSDPTKRKDTDSRKSSSNEGPRNMQQSTSDSEVFPSREYEQLQTSSCPPSQMPSQFISLHSHDNRDAIQGAVGPSLNEDKASYFVTSSFEEGERSLCTKLQKILRKHGHRVTTIHDVAADITTTTATVRDIKRAFEKADFVIIIYAANYAKEFTQQRLANWQLFQYMNAEFKGNGNINERFIPIFNTEVTRKLPDIFLRGNEEESNYIITLLNPSNHRGKTVVNSAPRGCGTTRNSLPSPPAAKTWGNGLTRRPRSEPVIITRQQHVGPQDAVTAATLQGGQQKQRGAIAKFFALFKEQKKSNLCKK